MSEGNRLVQNAQPEFKKHGLDVVSVAWEDTARSKNSCWGPNISDMTLMLEDGTQMMMIRTPNFSDTTVDFDLEKLNVLPEGQTSPISLKKYLENFVNYENVPEGTRLLKDGEKFGLAQAQGCILPLTSGKVQFAPNLYNYQSSSGHPGVLVISISAQGTTVTIPSGKKDPLYLRSGDKLCWYAAQANSVLRGTGVIHAKDMTVEEKRENMIVVVQIPLEIPRTRGYEFGSFSLEKYSMSYRSPPPVMLGLSHIRDRGLDTARLSQGTDTGKSYKPFKDRRNPYIRDERFPIRMTFQFYRIATKDLVSEDVADMARQIREVYEKGQDMSSLVMENTQRPTEPRDAEYLRSIWNNIGLF